MSPAPDVEVALPVASRLERRLLVLVVFLGLFVDYMLLTAVMPIFPHIKKTFGVTVFEIGCLFAIKPLLQAITDPILAPFVDRGWVWPFLAGLVLEAVTTTMFAFSESYAATMISRAFQGVASALIMTTGMALVARVHAHDDKARGIAMSLTVTGVASGVSLGPPLGGILFEIGGMKLPFLLMTGLTVIIFIIAVPVVCLHVKWQRARDLTTSSNGAKCEDGTGTLTEAAPRVSESSRNPFRRVLTDVYMLVVYGGIVFGNSAVGMLEPTLGLWMEHDHGYTPSTIGVSFVGCAVSTLVFGPLGGLVGNKIGRVPVVFCGIILLGGGYSGLTAGDGELWTIILALCVMGVGIGCVDGCSPALLGQIADLRHSSGVYGSVFALRGVAESIGFIAGPLLGSGMMDAIDFRTTTIVLGMCVASYAFVLFSLAFMPEFRKPKIPKSVSTETDQAKVDVETPVMPVFVAADPCKDVVEPALATSVLEVSI